MARGLCSAGLLLGLSVVTAAGQTPQPFPRPGETRTQAPPARPAAPAPTATAPSPAAGQLALPVAGTAPAGAVDSAAPRPDEVVFPVYPSAQFLSAYDAGRGQRYLLYGT